MTLFHQLYQLLSVTCHHICLLMLEALHYFCDIYSSHIECYSYFRSHFSLHPVDSQKSLRTCL